MTRDAAFWIERLHLSEHPEGGYYAQTYKASETVEPACLPARFPGPRPFSTAIYYLLAGDDFSAFHRIKSDELWHFYAGSSLSLHSIDPDGSLSTVRLGRAIERGETFQCVVPAGCWFAAEVNDADSYALVGCTVAPGFEYDDFELGERHTLAERYPAHKALIERLTRK